MICSSRPWTALRRKPTAPGPPTARYSSDCGGRAHRLGQKLDLFGLEDFPKGWVGLWLKQLERLEFEICLNVGKAHSRRKMKKSYRRLLKRTRKAAAALERELAGIETNLCLESLPPSRRAMLQQVLERIGNDLSDARRVADYAEDRVFRNQSLPSTEKILSRFDGSAAFIKKGGRELDLGVRIVSISGAKGKKLTDPEDWESEAYREARRNRSAVESLMFTIKEGFEFGELGRRGIDPVRAELMEKVLAYNCCRTILLKKRRREERKKAA